MMSIGPDPLRAVPRGSDTPEERTAVLIELEAWLDGPTALLGFVWLALMVVDFVSGLPAWLNAIETIIWVSFLFAVFGNVTATPATFFVGRGAESDEAEVASEKSILGMHGELEALRRELQAPRAELTGGAPSTSSAKE